MNYLEINENTFESIKHIDELGNEYWFARELMAVLEYNKWENFHRVIKSAMIACASSGSVVYDHFPEVRKKMLILHIIK